MNKYPIIKHVGSVTQFIDCWSKYYNAYSDEIYFSHINNDLLSENDIRELFVWKNGMKLSDLKSHSIETKVISKLMVINTLRKTDKLDFDTISANFKDVSAIWKIFLMHIINPAEFPIFDQHVYRAMRYIKTNQIEELRNNDQIKLRIYENEYLVFYRDLSSEINDYRKLDKALWAFGKFLTQGRIK